MKLFRVNALLLRHWYMTKNNPDRFLDIFFWPVLDLVIWGFTSLYVQEIAGGFIVAIFLGGLLLWHLFDRAQKDVTVYIIEDFWNKSVYNFYTTPMKESELFLSVMLLGIIRGLVSFVIMTLVTLVGWGFNIIDIGMIRLFLFVIPLLIFGWAIGILISGFIFKFGSRMSIVTWSLPFLLLPFSAVFYPAEILPKTVYVIAAGLPLIHVFEGFRGALNGVFLSDRFIIATVLSVIYFALCYFAFLYFVRKSRQSGFLSRQ